MSRWLRRNGGLLLITCAVVGALFGTRQVGIAVAAHKDALLGSQLIVPRALDDATGTFGEAQDMLHAFPGGQTGYARSAQLRGQAMADVAALTRSWPGRASHRAQADVVALAGAVREMAAELRSGHADRAAVLNRSIVIGAYARARASLSQAGSDLARQTTAAVNVERRATLAAALGASALLVLMIYGVARIRRRHDRAESDKRALRQAEERLSALVEHSSDVIVVVAPDSTVLYEAGSVATVLDLAPDELHGTKLTKLIEAEDEPLLLTLCRTVGHEDAEVRLRPRAGEVRTCEIRATSLLEHPGWQGVVLHIWDVSDRKTLEAELRLAQKLEAVGQLAAGIAHEINTPIQFVGDTNRFLDGAFADLQLVLDAYGELLGAVRHGTVTPGLVQRVEDAEETADFQYLRERIPDAFVRSSDGIKRVAKIVGAMRSFAHPPSLDPSLVDINDSIRNTLIVATNEYKYVADVKTELGDLPSVECNASDINQVLLNIIINAADAIAEVVGGSARRGVIEVRSWCEVDSVVIAIADSGPGIAPELADRVFDPFFTTKEVGRGTGQGLAISRSLIVERHHGSLTFESRSGGGTTFTIRLPARATNSPPVPLAA